MRYPVVLFDLDHTLLDSNQSEELAFASAMKFVGIDDYQPHLGDYRRINSALWAKVELGEISPNEVKVERHRQLLEHLGIDGDPVAMGDVFASGLANFGDLYPGALTLLDAAKAQGAKTAMITNGIGAVQRGRIERLGLAKYFDAVVISGEAGVSKPGTDIFDLVFQALGNPSKGDAVIIGDSLSSDIAGGQAYGISTVWYNPDGSTLPEGVQPPTYELATLAEIGALLAEPKDVQYSQNMGVKVVVDYEKCESNGVCMNTAPDVFEIRADDVLYILDETPGPEFLEQLEDAAYRCPKQAITLEQIEAD